MKKLIYLALSLLICNVTAVSGVAAKSPIKKGQTADTVIDPKKNPGAVDFGKHPEVLAKIRKEIKAGKIRFIPGANVSDSTLDLSKHPELVKAIIKNPANWPVILKAYRNETDSLSDLGRKRQVIRDILAYLIREHVVKSRGEVTSFLLTDKDFSINGKKLSEKRHNWLKVQYIHDPDYVVYYGNSEMKGKGIFQRRDNL